MGFSQGQRVADSTGVAGGVVREVLENGTYKVTWDDGNGNDLEIHDTGLQAGADQHIPPPKEYEGLPDNAGTQFRRQNLGNQAGAVGVGRGMGDQAVPRQGVMPNPSDGYVQHTTPVPPVNPLLALGPMSEVKLVALPNEDGTDVTITGLAAHDGIDLEENEFILTLRIPTAKLLAAVPKPPTGVIDLF